MMSLFTYENLVYVAKTYGLIYLIVVSICVVVYAYWPSNQEKFRRAAESVFSAEDKPWRK